MCSTSVKSRITYSKVQLRVIYIVLRLDYYTLSHFSKPSSIALGKIMLFFFSLILKVILHFVIYILNNYYLTLSNRIINYSKPFIINCIVVFSNLDDLRIHVVIKYFNTILTFRFYLFF